MHRIDIKPLSVNDAWKGRRFRTDTYRIYQKEIALKLKPFKIPSGKLFLHLKWGFSSKASDFDNPIKCFVDCLQKKYGFNDKLIYFSFIEKEDIKKGDEFIEFEIMEANITTVVLYLVRALLNKIKA